MGKSFNDDVFNNDFNLESINGLNISKEAIEENKQKEKPKIEINRDEIKEKIQEEKAKKKEKPSQQDEYERLLKEKEQIEQRNKEYEQEVKQDQEQQDNTIYVKKTMIFKQEYLDIIDGLANINDMQIKDVLNQLLEKSINELDEATRTKALKTGKKNKPVKQEKSIF